MYTKLSLSFVERASVGKSIAIRNEVGVCPRSWCAMYFDAHGFVNNFRQLQYWHTSVVAGYRARSPISYPAVFTPKDIRFDRRSWGHAPVVSFDVWIDKHGTVCAPCVLPEKSFDEIIDSLPLYRIY
jgi:hypothetical protein